MYFLIILLIVFFSLLVYWLNELHREACILHSKTKNFPATNRALPIIGDLYRAILKPSIHEKIKYFIEINSEYLTTFKVWFGTKPMIMINNPIDAKIVLASPYCTNKTAVYHMAIGGDGMFVANGDKWKNQRRHLNTTFNPTLLNSYSKDFNQFGRNMVIALESKTINPKQFDITSLLGAHITDLITRTIYGSHDHKFELSQYCYELVERLMILWGERAFKMYGFLLILLAQRLFKIASDEKKLNKELRRTLQPILDKKDQEYLERLKGQDENNNSPMALKEENFLDKLTRLRFEGTIAGSEYRHTVMTMFLAGTETTARSISSIILMLAIHEEYQDKVYKEIKQFYDLHNNEDIDITKISELSLLDRVIKESFRLFPVIPFFGRTTTRDIKITEGVIPAGTDIGISLVNMHTHPDIWGKDAHKFNPDNFLPENVAQRERCSFIPFSYGPRNCIGYKFAQISSYIGIIYLLKHYQFKTTLKQGELKIGYGLTTFLLNGYMVSVHRRPTNDSK